MKGIFAVLTLSGAFIGEWSFGMLASGKGVFLPLVAFVFCLWSWQIRFETRLWLGFAVGFIMDTVQLVPFGSFLLTFLTITISCEIFQLFFSNTESKITYGISIALSMLVFFGAFSFYSRVL